MQDDLPAMVGGVVEDVRQDVLEGGGERLAFEVAVRDGSVDVLFGEVLHKGAPQSGIFGKYGLAYVYEAGFPNGIIGGAPCYAVEPNGLGGQHVRKSGQGSAVCGAIGGRFVDCGEHAGICPPFVGEQVAEVRDK